MSELPAKYTVLTLKKHAEEGKFMTKDNFNVEERDMPTLREGQYLAKVTYLSCDPTQQIWITNIPQYMPPVKIGEVMRSGGIAVVVQSKTPAFAVGDLLSGLTGWTEYLVGDATTGFTKLPAGTNPELALGPLGMTTLTAYFGLFHIGKPIAGDIVVVSGAHGATGSMVVQIAKIAGCTVYGIAGGAEKCKAVKEVYGADDCIDYKSEDVSKRLQELTKCDSFNRTGGIDVYFDNVGGPILDAALANLAMKGRVAICGAISQYNKSEVYGPKNYLNLLMKRGTMEGFIISDFFGQVGSVMPKLITWVTQGKLKFTSDVNEADISEAPTVTAKLFSSSNKGKLSVKLIHK